MIILALTLLIVIPAMYHSYVEERKSDLEQSAQAIAEGMNRSEDLDYLKAVGKNYSKRITLISSEGVVLYDNYVKAEKLGNHKDRPEFQDAVKNGVGESTRLSSTLSERTDYYAIKLDDGNVLRLSETRKSTLGLFGSTASIIAFLIVIVVILAFLVSHKRAEVIADPLNKLNLENPLENDTYEELSPLLVRLDVQHKQISKQMAELDQNRREFEQITEEMDEGFVIFDHSGMVLTINHSAKDLFSDGIYGGSYLELNRGEGFITAVRSALTGDSYLTKVELNGRIYSYNCIPVDEGSGQFGAVLFISDITEKESTERMRREFSANVSHELKTPLTSIMGYAEIIENGIAKNEDVPHFAHKIHGEARRLLDLIQDIIRVSKLDENTLGTDTFEEVNMSEMAQEAISQLTAKAEAKDVTITLDADPSVSLSAQKSVLHEMIFNLIDNAIAYNKDGGKVIVTVKNRLNGPYLSVEDNGIGIKPEYQSRVFERFYRVDKSHSKETGGTGLGLSIVKHGAMIHNAKLSLESEPGVGSKFTIQFPKTSVKNFMENGFAGKKK